MYTLGEVRLGLSALTLEMNVISTLSPTMDWTAGVSPEVSQESQTRKFWPQSCPAGRLTSLILLGLTRPPPLARLQSQSPRPGAGPQICARTRPAALDLLLTKYCCHLS